MSVTVDGAETQAVLPGLVPGKTYQVTVTAMRGLDESNPSTDTVTTGGRHHRLLSSHQPRDGLTLVTFFESEHDGI